MSDKPTGLNDSDFNDEDFSGENFNGSDLHGQDLSYLNFSLSDLRDANLSDTDLSNANLSGADLNGADLNEAILTKALLIDADFSEADLSGAILNNAILGDTDFSGANFSDAELRGLDFFETILCGAILKNSNLYGLRFRLANLCGADLSGANLSGAILSKANLSNTTLRGARLNNTDLRWTILNDADLYEADLSESDLSVSDLINTNLNKAIMTDARLNNSRLISSDLRNATITGVCLYGTSRDDWIIDDINCDYVYWDSEGKDQTPKDRDFKPSEFEELYKSLPQITYYFSDEFTPITPLVMDKVVNSINQKYPQFELRLDSFHSRGTPHAVFTVLHKEHTDDALVEVTSGYEKTIQRLEGKLEGYQEAFSKALDKNQSYHIKRIENMGHTFGDINSGRDTNIATDQGTVNVSQDVINLINKTISESEVGPDDKQDAQQQLENLTQELAKPEPDKGRIKRCYDYVVGVIPKVAEVMPWDKLIEKTLGL